MAEYIVRETDCGLATKQEIVEELVRCKDCKWWTKQEASLQGRCEAYGMYPTGEWFCARGERKDDERP